MLERFVVCRFVSLLCKVVQLYNYICHSLYYYITICCFILCHITLLITEHTLCFYHGLLIERLCNFALNFQLQFMVSTNHFNEMHHLYIIMRKTVWFLFPAALYSYNTSRERLHCSTTTLEYFEAKTPIKYRTATAFILEHTHVSARLIALGCVCPVHVIKNYCFHVAGNPSLPAHQGSTAEAERRE